METKSVGGYPETFHEGDKALRDEYPSRILRAYGPLRDVVAEQASCPIYMRSPCIKFVSSTNNASVA